MPTIFRPILPKPQTFSANSSDRGGVPYTTPPIFPKNPAPCANCSSAQQACLIHHPYSPSLCKKCAREHRDRCPAHMHRADAVLWKRVELESKQAAIVQPVPIEPVPVSKENPPTKGNANIILALPEITPSATIQIQEGAELQEYDAFEPSVSEFVEDCVFPLFTEIYPTPEQNHDDVVFHVNRSDYQYLGNQELVGHKEDDCEPHVFGFPPLSAKDPTPAQNHDEMVLNFNELDQFGLTAMFTTDDNFQGHANLIGDDFEPHISGIVGDLTFLQFTDNVLTPAQNHSEVVFNLNELDQQFDPQSMFTMDENFQDLFSPAEDDIQYLNANFDALWEEFE